MNTVEKNETPKGSQDSLGFPIKKNPWLIYALAHIPIVIIMVVILYVLYQSKS